jgi:hypothetical protein
MKHWDELTVLEQYAETFWDMYKDAYGFRPRHIDTSGWTEADFEAEFEVIGREIKREAEALREKEAAATADFEARVNSIILLGAVDRATALRWIHMAEGTDGDDSSLCYTLGLPYGYLTVKQ